MNLILWRHAAAVESGDGLDDLDRPLTPRGQRQAERMAQWLNRHLADNVLVIASPAVRTVATAEALGRKVRVMPELGPAASAVQWLGAAQWPESRRTVVLVGHQPALGQAAALALTGSEAEWPMRKASVWWLRHRVREGVGSTVLMCAQSPETL